MSSNEQQALGAVTQADRDTGADIWRDYIAKVGEVIVERQMRQGNLDGGLPAVARYSTRACEGV